jgi:hypothetical protein
VLSPKLLRLQFKHALRHPLGWPVLLHNARKLWLTRAEEMEEGDDG